MFKNSCPDCGGNNAKKLSLLAQMGKNSSFASSAKFAYPHPPVDELNGFVIFGGIVFGFIAAYFAYSMLTGFWSVLIGMVLSFILGSFLVIWKFDNREHAAIEKEYYRRRQNALEKWRETWMCLNCGKKYIPDEDKP